MVRTILITLQSSYVDDAQDNIRQGHQGDYFNTGRWPKTPRGLLYVHWWWLMSDWMLLCDVMTLDAKAYHYFGIARDIIAAIIGPSCHHPSSRLEGEMMLWLLSLVVFSSTTCAIDDVLSRAYTDCQFSYSLNRAMLILVLRKSFIF